MGAYRRPAACDGVFRAAFHNGVGPVKAVVKPQKGLAVGVKAVYGRVYREDGVVVTALAVLRLMVNRAAAYFYFTGTVIPLEVGHVVVSVPKAELHEGEKLYMLFGAGLIFQHEPVDFTVAAERYEGRLLGCDAVF